MSKLLVAFGLCMMFIFSAMPVFATEFYEDQATGQLFTKPGEGRVPVDVTINPATGKGKPAADYSSQAFSEAVRHVVSDAESATFPKVKVGALFYGEYMYNSHGPTGANKFSLNRGYINVRAEMTPEIKARITPDITRDSTGDFKFRLKFGYLDFHNFLSFYPSFEVKAGQYETAWLDYEEAQWTYRVIDTMLIEKEKFFNSADLGVGFKGKIPAGYGDWQVDVINGEGYHADENNKYKTIQARLTLVPMPNNDLLKGLNITGFYSTGRDQNIKGTHLQRDRAIAYIGYKYQDDLYLGAEYDWTHGADGFIAQPSATAATNFDGNGFSTMAWFRMPFLKPLRMLGRYDWFNHDDNAPKNDAAVSRYIVGGSYDITKNVVLVFCNEHTIAETGIRAKEPNENLWKVDIQWSF